MVESNPLCLVAAGTPPEGVDALSKNPASLAPVMLALMSILTLWAIIFTGARFHVNIRKLGWSDYFVLIALIITIGVLGYEATLIRTARHIWDVPACYFDAKFAMGIYFTAILFSLGAFFAKASIFVLFSHIFTIDAKMRYAIWIGQVFNFLIYFTGFGVVTYYSSPHIGETWVDTLDGRSLIGMPWWQTMSALIVALDIYIFVLPLPALLKLKVPMRRKIQLIAIFSLAVMGIGASIASLVQRIKITTSNDQTWIFAVLTLCSFVELAIAIIVSSAPGFAGFMRSYPLNLSSLVGSLVGNSKATSRLGLVGSKKASSSVVDDRDSGPNRNREYYELNDSWLLKSGVAADIERMDKPLTNANTTADGGIMRTLVVEQEFRTAAEENLAK